MTHSIHYETFKAGSRTYFNSSRFFPPAVKSDVFVLYGFVRTADNFVDAVPQDPEGFHAFVDKYRAAAAGEHTGDTIIDTFAELSGRKGFDPSWTEAFLHSMSMDLHKSVHATLPETLEYVYGSAEVIGLYMARILGLSDTAFEPAKYLGRAMQFINFIRDINEDNSFGRVYLPISEAELPDLKRETAEHHKEAFETFVRAQLDRYYQWQYHAEEGYRHIPRRYRVAIKTAGDMYKWTGNVIRANPFVVFQRKVKPARTRIVLQAMRNFVFMAA